METFAYFNDTFPNAHKVINISCCYVKSGNNFPVSIEAFTRRKITVFTVLWMMKKK